MRCRHRLEARLLGKYLDEKLVFITVVLLEKKFSYSAKTGSYTYR